MAWAFLPAEPVPEGAGFAVASRWREELAYSEGERSFAFDATWGGAAAQVFVPDAATWDAVVPDWLRGRRDEVVERLRRHGGHALVDVADGYGPGGRCPE